MFNGIWPKPKSCYDVIPVNVYCIKPKAIGEARLYCFVPNDTENVTINVIIKLLNSLIIFVVGTSRNFIIIIALILNIL